jgi:hypothetical protein|tara:strand:- start:4245 stop:4361 length:117 start_codon:yes stop_codon:yes gene_type:complete
VKTLELETSDIIALRQRLDDSLPDQIQQLVDRCTNLPA